MKSLYMIAALAASGLAGMLAADYQTRETPAVEARLIGRCDGRIMAAMEESAFPAGCDWIEPIRYSEEDRNGATALRLGESR